VTEPLVIVGHGMAAARLVDELTAPLRLIFALIAAYRQSPSQAQGAASLKTLLSACASISRGCPRR
jgi:hypothetical protein